MVPGVHPDKRSDAALVRSARLGDTEAFAAIVDRHGPVMRRYARFILGDDDEADDVTQEALVSAWRSLASYRGEAALRTWLFTLVSRRAADLRRRRRPVPVTDDDLHVRLPPAADDATGEAVATGLLAALRAALLTLPWHQRACWLLREVEGQRYDEIAETLGLTQGQVRGYLHRARPALAARMEEWR